jgi:hypothetical protein
MPGHEDCGCGEPVDCPDCEGTCHEPVSYAVLEAYYGILCLREKTEAGLRFKKDEGWDYYKEVDCKYAFAYHSRKP